MNHTPTPWYNTALGSLFGAERNDGDDHEMIGHCDASGSAITDSANAAHIVKCVNAWDDAEALRARLAELGVAA
jgi:hypothetical protein